MTAIEQLKEQTKSFKHLFFDAYGYLPLSVTCECDEDDHVHTT